MKSPYTGTEMTIHTRKAILSVRGESFELDYEYYLDPETNEEFITTEMGDRNLMQVYNQYNAIHGTNLPED